MVNYLLNTGLGQFLLIFIGFGVGPPGCLIWIPTVMVLHQNYRCWRDRKHQEGRS